MAKSEYLLGLLCVNMNFHLAVVKRGNYGIAKIRKLFNKALVAEALLSLQNLKQKLRAVAEIENRFLVIKRVNLLCRGQETMNFILAFAPLYAGIFVRGVYAFIEEIFKILHPLLPTI